MIRSVRSRLVLSYVLFAILTITLLGILGLSLVRRSLKAQEIEFLTLNAEGIAEEAAALVWPTPRYSELQEVAESASFVSGTRVKILDRDRVVLADSGRPAGLDQFVFIFPPLEIPFETLDGRFGTLIMRFPTDAAGSFLDVQEFQPRAMEILQQFPPDTRFTVIERVHDRWGGRVVFETEPRAEPERAPNRSTQTLSVPVFRSNQTIGYVEISQGPNFSQEAIVTIRRAFLIAAGGVVILAGLVGLFAARWLTDPLQGLAEAARRMGAGDLTVRAPEDQSTETGEVATQFNQMAASLEANFITLSNERDTLRRFIADASHELRTPITALKNFNELLRGPADQDPETRREFLQESHLQIARLEWLTNNLLDLSRLESGLAALDLENCDIWDLLGEVVNSQAHRAAEKGISLTLRPKEQEIRLVCDRSRMALAVGNLVDNAIKFNRPGGQVILSVHHKAGKVLIRVEDTGFGIDPDEGGYIYDRFYRGKGHTAEGSGLGLAIVKSVVEAHEGTIELASSPGKGSQFTLVFPLAE